jgi:O-antigen ligase
LRTNATVSIPLLAADGFVPYTIFVVILTMLFGGGGTYQWPDAVVQLSALPLLAWALFKLTPSELGRGGRWAIGLLCAIFALPLLQLIPMAPSLWTGLPGRGEIASAYEAAGMKLPWLPISLYPAATWLGLLSLLPAAAVFLAMLSFDRRSRRLLVIVLFVIIFPSVFLGMLQIMGGEDSPLRFYPAKDRVVGFFANPDHNAAFLYSAIPFVTAWMIGVVHDRRQNSGISLFLLALLVVTIIIGVAVTHSRSGMALLFVAGLSSLLLAWRHDRGGRRRLLRFAIGANLVALLLAFQFGFVGFISRFEYQGFDDLRWPVNQITLRAAIANLPFGSGFGTFTQVYEQFAPRTLLAGYYVNHAHNDWLESWLTRGIPAIMLTVGFLAWLVASILRLWKNGEPDTPVLDLALAQAASVVIVLLLLHSAMDYPLRIAAVTVLFAIACGYMISGRKTEGTAEQSAEIESLAPDNAVWLRNRF